ncbi:MAG: polymer-forming cytoskeletal protein [Elusimicrobia bacterium]|nr:polymer-forming cytoskeletal protein [Elusimicrobiota bacterium]
MIGENGKVIGDINAQSVLISGEVSGNIHAYISVELMEDAKVAGDIKTSQISINEGAFFQGNVTMERSHLEEAEVKESLKPSK